MLKNHLKVAWRNLKKNKAFSLINIFGLSVGMSAFMLILQYVSFELSFDKFHKNGENIYRIRNDRGYKDELFQKGVTTYPFVPIALKKDFPEVLNYVRIAPWIADHTLIKYGEKVLREKELLFAENSFFNLFSFQLTRGDATTALKNPFSIVLSETRAKQIFGEDNPI